MAITLSLTEQQTMTALRTVLAGVMPAGTQIIRAKVNRVPEPKLRNFIVMTPLFRVRLATNVDRYLDPGTNPGTKYLEQSTEVTVQLDVHGPASADNAQILSTYLRDESATTAFDALNLPVQTLYADDPRQMPFVNAEQQWEWRWCVDAHLQANPQQLLPQDFADEVIISVTSETTWRAGQGGYLVDAAGNIIVDGNGNPILLGSGPPYPVAGPIIL